MFSLKTGEFSSIYGILAGVVLHFGGSLLHLCHYGGKRSEETDYVEDELKYKT